ncbi:MAG: hypothetical protein AABZ39_15800 [Spirochaetota bacterium]
MPKIMKTVLIFVLGIAVIALALVIDKSMHTKGFIGIAGLIVGWALVCFLGLNRL